MDDGTTGVSLFYIRIVVSLNFDEPYRICPGRFLAENTLWLAFASILSLYKLDYAVDENGKCIGVFEAFDVPPGVLKSVTLLTFPPLQISVECIPSHPKDFRCSIKPRSLQHEKLIRFGYTDTNL